ncbi:hypothetical protein BpHYR1_001419 [Brachionus plicatilis]|uniref:Uncharacterized protein n=1 Tax=Brachionus plicatilis TaxID=10195 RepID=A0A3M7RWE7_BRAPC|nr:hypothetical protein BpHYR1_001419 [Brachionus plicatilis]
MWDSWRLARSIIRQFKSDKANMTKKQTFNFMKKKEAQDLYLYHEGDIKKIYHVTTVGKLNTITKSLILSHLFINAILSSYSSDDKIN